jgi:hypothetical protein
MARRRTKAMHKAGAPAASIIAVSKPGAPSRVHQTFEVCACGTAGRRGGASSVVLASRRCRIGAAASYLLALIT